MSNWTPQYLNVKLQTKHYRQSLQTYTRLPNEAFVLSKTPNCFPQYIKGYFYFQSSHQQYGVYSETYRTHSVSSLFM